ncbi:MAG: hypothetical protein KDD61_04810, partial [Bdellovibrionales bacterium]|nr:hypothetical protein [Bdellovibrionales bacterium]
TAKLHHKLIAIGEYITLGTSFNFSVGAASNNEQLMILKSKKYSDQMRGAFDWLFSKTTDRDILENVILDRNHRWEGQKKSSSKARSESTDKERRTQKNQDSEKAGKCVKAV